MPNPITNFFANLLGTTTTTPAATPVATAPSPTPVSTVNPAPVAAGLIYSPTISISNLSTVLTDAQVNAIIPALQIQVSRDLAPAWGVNANLQFLPKTMPKPNGNWLINIMDNSDQAGALGYHDLTSDGLPMAKIFAKDDMTYNLSWTVTLSHELCLTGDTKIPLLSGETVEIKDLVGRDQFYVYSCDDAGNIKWGNGHSARITQQHAPVFKVTLDNGEEIKCTDNHPFLMRDGSYKEAKDLKPNDSLMPLYRREHPIDVSNRKKLYEQVYNPATDDWKFTHRVVQQHCTSGYVRHHIDFNSHNNSPDNIAVMQWKDHQLLHADHIIKHLNDFIASGRKRNYTEEGLKRWHLNRNIISENCDFCRRETEHVNHKVVSVEFYGYEDVYDLTVDKYHNFALNAGVFVHNCEMLIDPYIANCSFAQSSDLGGVLYAWEISDAVEDDSCGYRINGVLVSDFVYPTWFEGFRTPGSTKFDFMGKVTQPFQLAPGGYISQFIVGPGSQGWSQITADTIPTVRNKQKGDESRFVRRQKSRKPDLVLETKNKRLAT